MPEGHRVFAARSVLDGREHDGSLDAEGATPIAPYFHEGDPRTPSGKHTSQVKRRRAVYARVLTAANRAVFRGLATGPF